MTQTANLMLTLLEQGQLQPEVTINNDLQIIDSLAGPAIQFGYKQSTTTGLTFGYYGGRVYSNGSNVTIADGTIGLTASTTNYVQRTAAGTVSVNTTGYTTGLIPMATVVTGASSITTVTDTRPASYDLRGRQVITTTGGASTLTDAQVNARILSIQGALTSNAVITLPVYQQEWTISNETTGAFTVQVQTASGSPVVIGQGMAEKFYGNGSILKSSESRLLQESDLFGDFIASGIIGAPVTGLSMTLPAGGAYVLGQRTTPAAYPFTYAASSDSYVDLSPSGAYTVTAVANGAAEPAVTSGSVRTQVVVTSATDVTGVNRRLASSPTMTAQKTNLSYYGSAQALAAGVFTPLIFPTVDLDTLGEYNTTTGTFTPQEDGLYLIFITLEASDAGITDQRVLVSMAPNAGADGTRILAGYTSSSATLDISAMRPVQMVGGVPQYFNCYVSTAETLAGGQSCAISIARLA